MRRLHAYRGFVYENRSTDPYNIEDYIVDLYSNTEHQLDSDHLLSLDEFKEIVEKIKPNPLTLT